MLADTRIVYLFVYVRDLARSRAFYEETLGLRVIEHDEDSVKFDCGEVILALNRAADYGIELPEIRDNATDIVFLVDDLEAMRSSLERRGVTFLPTSWYDVGGIADFYDPDGHWLTLYEPGPEAMGWPSGKRISAVRAVLQSRNGHRPAGELTLDGSTIFYVFFFVPDPDEALRFYHEQLGLRDLEGGPCSQATSGDEDGVIKYDTGAVLLTTHFFDDRNVSLDPVDDEEHACPPRELDAAHMQGVAPAFYVEGVERVVEELRQRRPGFAPKVSRSDIGVVATCADPGGHLFFLYEPSRRAYELPSGERLKEIVAATL